MKSQKNIFVEKPLAINDAQLFKVIEEKPGYTKNLMVGFNRRFAQISETIKKEFHNINEPLVISMRINAGYIPKSIGPNSLMSEQEG
jgi:polar amino acid transport system substrate-binding protein